MIDKAPEYELVNEQWLIVYNEGGKERIYSTAYTTEECKRQCEECRRAHPAPYGGVKAITAASRPPKDDLPRH